MLSFLELFLFPAPNNPTVDIVCLFMDGRLDRNCTLWCSPKSNFFG